MTTATQTEPSAPSMSPAPAPKLTTYRVENRVTARTLLNGFHCEPVFTDRPDAHAIAEFGSREIAEAVIERLQYRVRLAVTEIEWPHALDDTRTSRLCRAVADTGACVNLLFWNPSARTARALAGFGSEG